MKLNLRLWIILFASISIFASSCTTQNHIQLVGHFPKPKQTQVHAKSAPEEQNVTISPMQSPEAGQLTASANPDQISEIVIPHSSYVTPPAPVKTQEAKKNVTVKAERNKLLESGKIKTASKHKSDNDMVLVAIIVAFFIPFLGVLIYEGELTTHFWIALLLTLLFWLPGFIYAVLVITGSIS